MSQPEHDRRIDYVEFPVADVEVVASAVRAAGGEITQPTYDFPGGRRFHFRDPCGHELAVWSDAVTQA